MFKHAAFAAAAATAFVAAPATAATVVYETGTVIALTYQPVTDSWDGAFRYRVNNAVPGLANGAFTASFTFVSPVNGEASATSSNVIVSGMGNTDINFTAAFLNGNPGSVINFGGASTAWVFDVPVSPGVNTVSFSGFLNPNGNGVGDALATGSLTLAAVVPEPATWALFILGFGAIGHTMRRRSSKVRVAKASLNFA